MFFDYEFELFTLKMAKKQFGDLDDLCKQKIFMELSLNDLEACIQVSHSWKKFITQNIWNSPSVIDRRLEKNWNIDVPRYSVQNETVQSGLEKPFLICATPDYLVLQNYDNLDDGIQTIKVLNLEDESIWDIWGLGPTKPLKILYGLKYWNKYLRLKVKLNKKILLVTHEHFANLGCHTLRVFSCTSHNALFEENIDFYCSSDIIQDTSAIIIFDKFKVEIIHFNEEGILSRESCLNETPLMTYENLGYENSRASFPFGLYWESRVYPRANDDISVWKTDEDLKMLTLHIRDALQTHIFSRIDFYINTLTPVYEK